MAALDDILATPIAPKPVRLPNRQEGVRGYDVSNIGDKKTNLGSPTAKPKAPLAAGEKYPEVRRDINISDISTPPEAPQDVEKNRMSYLELFEAMNPNKPETDEEKAKREKREKREAWFAALGDGISALSNLYFTTRGAKSSYDASQGMSAKTRERWDKLKALRDAQSRDYYNGYVRAISMDEAKDRDDRNWQHTIEREKIADERYEVKEARDKALADLNEQLKRHQITAAEYKAEQERIATQFAEDNEKLKQENLRAGVQQKKAAAGASYASANASNARADYYRNGGSSGGKHGPTLQLEDDEPMHFGDDKDYDRAVMRLASDYGVPTTEVQVTERNHKGEPKKQRTIQRTVKDIAADIEREAAKRKKASQNNNTMPGVGGNRGSANTMPGVK